MNSSESNKEQPVAWLCEFFREDETTDRQVVLEDPECTRWADVADGDGVSPYRVTPLYASPQAAPQFDEWLERAKRLIYNVQDWAVMFGRGRCTGKEKNAPLTDLLAHLAAHPASPAVQVVQPAQEPAGDLGIDEVPIFDHEQAALYEFTKGTRHYDVVRTLYRLAHAHVNAAPQPAPACTHEPFQGRCVHCDVPFVNGRPAPPTRQEDKNPTWCVGCSPDGSNGTEVCSGCGEGVGKLAPAPAQPAPVVPQEVRMPLSIREQQAVLDDLMGLQCLINYHDCKEVEAAAIEPGAGEWNAKRALELLAIGRAIIDRDPELWYADQKEPFKPRQREINAAMGKTIPATKERT